MREPDFQQLTIRAYQHIEKLAGEIGARGSCTNEERRGSEYVRENFQKIGLDEIEIQDFKGSPSSYSRYALAFAVALLSQLLAGLRQSEWIYAFSAMIHAVSALAIYAESDFRWNWTHWFIRPKLSRNVLACSPARKIAKRMVVLTAHIDSHRTPFFNSSLTWQRIYNLGFGLLFFVVAINSGAATLLAIADLPILKIIFNFLGFLLLIGVIAFVHADRTPYSPGAYDNASGVACMLALAELVHSNPLDRTTAWFVATGCEETGAGGMQALLKSKSVVWREALWVNLDQSGIGDLYVRLKEGMLKRYAIQPAALSLAQQASQSSGIRLRERESQAFSDAVIALKGGYLAISLGASPSEPDQTTPRHQLTDLPAKIEHRTLRETLLFVSSLLELWEEGGQAP
jgi:hypothetical protein